MMMLTPQDAYARLLAVVGGTDGLAAALGITSQAVYAWKEIVPEKHLTAVLKAARRVKRQRLPTKQELRPDLYPKPRGARRGTPKTNGEDRGSSQEESSSET